MPVFFHTGRSFLLVGRLESRMAIQIVRVHHNRCSLGWPFGQSDEYEPLATVARCSSSYDGEPSLP